MRGALISRRTALLTALAATTASATGDARAQSSVNSIKTSDGRDVRVSIWAADAPERGVILFSHGALSSPQKYARLIEPWAQAGFKVYAPLHVDSTDHPDHERLGKVSWPCRMLDMRALSAVVNAPSYVAAGHSYGGLVALTLGGVSAEPPPGVDPPLRDPRARCVLAFSPPGPTPTLVTLEGFKTLAVPAMIQTGDKDVPFGAKDGRWQAHLAAYDQAPPGDKYALVLAGVNHYFGNIICSPERTDPPETEPFERAVKISTTFLEAYGARDHAAKRRLDDALAASGPVQLARK